MKSPCMLLAMSLVAGCGGGGVHSDLPRDKQAATETDPEARLSCAAVQTYLEAVFPRSEQQETLCIALALSQDSDASAEACRGAVRTCLADPPDPFELSCLSQTTPTGCNATVGEVEACASADVDAYVARAATVDCSISGNTPAIVGVIAPVPTPAACTRIAETCPQYAHGYFPFRTPFAAQPAP